MQLPSCESDLNKTGRVDLATEHPEQTEGLFTGQSQSQVTYLVAHFSFVFTLHFSPSQRAGDGQIQTSLKSRRIVPQISLAFWVRTQWFFNQLFYSVSHVNLKNPAHP